MKSGKAQIRNQEIQLPYRKEEKNNSTANRSHAQWITEHRINSRMVQVLK
jgi:hypothetical protein